MRAYAKRPGEPWGFIEIANELKPLQDFVGGHIEAVTLTSDIVLLCNEEGLIRGLPYGGTVLRHKYVGPLLLVGVDGEEFTDVSWQAELFTEEAERG